MHLVHSDIAHTLLVLCLTCCLLQVAGLYTSESTEIKTVLSLSMYIYQTLQGLEHFRSLHFLKRMWKIWTSLAQLCYQQHKVKYCLKISFYY